MKVYFIFPDVYSYHKQPYHPGLASIAAVLIGKGHDIRIGYLDNLNKAEGILKEISEFDPDLIGFTAVETQFRYIKYLTSKIKKIKSRIIICGGSYATLAPEIILQEDSHIDAVIRGEGEHATLQLLEKLEKCEDWLTTNNLAYKDSKTGQLIKNPLNPIIENLDSLPYPNTVLFPYQEIIDRNNTAIFHFNRGCPFQCSYCSNHAIGKVYGKSFNPLRYRSINSAIDEIGKTTSSYKLRNDTVLVFGDDLFIFDKNWLEEFCTLYKQKIHRPFWCTGRSNLITDDICSFLKDAGCVMIFMSVESGNDYIRNKVMLRNISREVLFNSFDLCYKHGINTCATCVIGLPFETKEMIEDSIKTVAQLKSVTAHGINSFYPYRGTYLREVCEEKGYMPKEIGDFIERKESILNLPDLSKETILYYNKNWIKLIGRHKSRKERWKLFIRQYWADKRNTPLGDTIRFLIYNTRFGKKFKKIVMKFIWHR